VKLEKVARVDMMTSLASLSTYTNIYNLMQMDVAALSPSQSSARFHKNNNIFSASSKIYYTCYNVHVDPPFSHSKLCFFHIQPCSFHAPEYLERLCWLLVILDLLRTWRPQSLDPPSSSCLESSTFSPGTLSP